MTIAASDIKTAPFAGDGVQTRFDFSFKVLNSKDVEVYINDEKIASGYTVTLLSTIGGYVTLSSALALGSRLVIIRNVVLEQQVDLQDGQAFYPEVLEGSLDRSTMILQQLQEQLKRSVKAPNSEATLDELPSASSRANKLLMFDSSGQPKSATAVEFIDQNALNSAREDSINAASAAENAAQAAANSAQSLAYAAAGVSNRNLLINGNFLVRQFGETATIPAVTGTVRNAVVDRWWYWMNTDTDALGPISISYDSALRLTATSTAGNSASNIYLYQDVKISPEWVGKTFTFSIRYRLSMAASAGRKVLDAAGYVTGMAGDTGAGIASTILTADGEWHTVSMSGTIPDKTIVRFIFALGLTTAGDYFDLAFAKMEAGSVATAFVSDYERDLAVCRQYYNASLTGRVVQTTGTAPDQTLPMTGGSISKATYAQLWSWATAASQTRTLAQYNADNTLRTFFIDNGDGTFRLPDWRDLFLRSTGASRNAGTYQADELKSHRHMNGVVNNTDACFNYGGTTTDVPGSATDSMEEDQDARTYQGYTSTTGGAETRPVNVSINHFIYY